MSRPPSDLSCIKEPEIQKALAITIEETLYMVASAGIELQALDGITVAPDCRAAACELQNLPEGQTPLEMNPQPNVMEMARTTAVRREGDLRFHIVLRPGLGLMTLSPDAEMRRVAQACICHEAAHVEHESRDIRLRPTPSAIRFSRWATRNKLVHSLHGICKSTKRWRSTAPRLRRLRWNWVWLTESRLRGTS